MRRAQSITMDLLLALFLIVGGLILVVYLFSAPAQSENVSDDSFLLSQAIFEPYPHDWNTSTVIRPGFVINHRYNETLFAQFQSLTPSQVNILTGITTYYYVQLKYINGSVFGSAGQPPIVAESLHATKRAAVMNGTIIIVEVQAWI